jgi:hypothetical protein
VKHRLQSRPPSATQGMSFSDDIHSTQPSPLISRATSKEDAQYEDFRPAQSGKMNILQVVGEHFEESPMSGTQSAKDFLMTPPNSMRVSIPSPKREPVFFAESPTTIDSARKFESRPSSRPTSCNRSRPMSGKEEVDGNLVDSDINNLTVQLRDFVLSREKVNVGAINY